MLAPTTTARPRTDAAIYVNLPLADPNSRVAFELSRTITKMKHFSSRNRS
jgi:hypothetical protein